MKIGNQNHDVKLSFLFVRGNGNDSNHITYNDDNDHLYLNPLGFSVFGLSPPEACECACAHNLIHSFNFTFLTYNVSRIQCVHTVGFIYLLPVQSFFLFIMKFNTDCSLANSAFLSPYLVLHTSQFRNRYLPEMSEILSRRVIRNYIWLTSIFFITNIFGK